MSKSIRNSTKVEMRLFRAAGVIIQNEKVLLHRSTQDNFWSLPGGSIKTMEFSQQTVEREFQEEAKITVKTLRLLWIVEHQFENKQGKFNEMGLYYLVEPKDSYEKLAKESFKGVEDDYTFGSQRTFELEFRWFPLEKLHNITLYPSFLKKALQKIPDYPTHIRTFS